MNSYTFPSINLLQCKKGTQARVTDIFPQPKFGNQDPHVSLRLKELGFLPGARIEVIGFGFLGADPLALKVNGTKFALRRTEAEKIGVEIIPTGNH
ncbi:MAG: ferrous iron transport protein A [Cellvibrio sp.]|jgi:ferrous iron transport protein A|nr:ferrous iron transport protein A [Cellvibrio sp.]